MINSSDFKKYFVLRMREMMHRDTLDSYRVRVNNAYSILIELKSVLVGWETGSIRHFITVEYCIKECISLLESEETLEFSNFTKQLMLDELKQYVEKSKSKNDRPDINLTSSIIYTIEDTINCNKNIYYTNLYDKIIGFLNDTQQHDEEEFCTILKKFDILVSSFGCELIRRGFSKKYLYGLFNDIKEKLIDNSYEEALNNALNILKEPKLKSYKVIINLSFDSQKYAETARKNASEIVQSVPVELSNYITVHKNYISINTKKCFYIHDATACDSSSAARIGYEALSDLLDINQDVIKKIKIPDFALVIDTEHDNHVSTELFYILDRGGRYTKESKNSLQEVLDTCKNSEFVNESVRDRIISAFRHLRIGDSQIEIEQQFINYWIALEFIFSTGDRNSSTFERIKTYMIGILSVCYVKRNVEYLKNWLVRTNLMNRDDDILKFLNADFSQSKIKNNILESYHVRRMKSHLHHRDKIKQYVSNHKVNLEQHIVRIYRLRNELVHEAAIKQDIMNVTSNLRFYLVFILNQLIGFCLKEIEAKNEVTIDRFFWFYSHWKRLIENTEIEDGYLKVPIADNYIF